jgi:hypothetical protein
MAGSDDFHIPETSSRITISYTAGLWCVNVRRRWVVLIETEALAQAYLLQHRIIG